MIVRLAELDDLLEIWGWRNDPQTRKMSFDASIVSLDDHTRWFNRSLQSESRFIYVGEEGSEKIGNCRFDLDPSQGPTEVSINLNPLWRGRRVAKKFLMLSLKDFSVLHDTPILARIKRENTPSIRLFESCGFRASSSSEGTRSYLFAG